MERIQVKEFKEKKYYFIPFGYGWHGEISFRLWINHKLIDRMPKDEDGLLLPIPIKDVEIQRGRKDYVLRTGSGYLFDIYIPCGYRGGANFEIIEPEPIQVVSYVDYRSPVGSLGISQGALVVVNKPFIVYKWHRTGRLYGSEPEGITRIIYNKDGEAKEEKLDIVDEDELNAL